ncbi:hypothetical protein ABEB36_008144 [Hypothenemus hampei]|uniref:Uncharacterized protein n=1 Tax=Hypothenemus hampei TaxID=57062 RepID=A0ABD1EKW1_HYPHA
MSSSLCHIETLKLSIQRKLKNKRTSKILGDGEANKIINSIETKYSGNIRMRESEDGMIISVLCEGFPRITLYCREIVSCNIANKKITLQLREDYFAEKLVLTFYGKEQVTMFEALLPPIQRPPRLTILLPDHLKRKVTILAKRPAPLI